jgi:phage terminase large subunit GpA-like protein
MSKPHATAPAAEKLKGKTVRLFRGVIQAIIEPKPRKKMHEWADENIIVPDIVGSPFPGPLDSGRLPMFRGLLDRLELIRVRFFNLCKSARTGGSLFFGIVPVLHKIDNRPGPILWIDPTRKTGARLSRQEIQPFIKACKAVNALRIRTKKAWTTLEMIFKTCTFGICGAGSVADLGGRQAEMLLINEKDKIPAKSRAEAPPGLLALVRTKLFRRTRKVISNSTPTLESAETWGDFLAGSQLHGYLPCPECGGYQPLTFFREPAQPDRWMRVDEDDPILIGHEIKRADRHGIELNADSQRAPNLEIKKAKDKVGGYLVKGIPQTGRIWWPPELQDKKTKVWNVDEVERQARYECAFCEAKIPQERLNWMNARYALRSHNPAAPSDIESAHIWAAYSPMDLGWGGLAKKYLLSIGNIAKMHDCYNSDWGKPFERTPTRITRRIIELMQSRTPVKYDRANPLDPEDPCKLPIRPCFITMTADVQQTEYWWMIWAWSIEAIPYLLAWGSCVSQKELIDISNRVWTFDFEESEPDGRKIPPEKHVTWKGIIDSGYKAKRQAGVYRFVHEQGGRWIASKGGHFQGGKEKPIFETTIAFNYDGAQVDIAFVHYNDDQMQEHLYRFVIKERQHARGLPQKLDEQFLEQVTSPHLAAVKMADGRTAHEWRYTIDPHLGDTWKQNEIFHFIFSQDILIAVRAQQDAIRKSRTETKTAR